MAIAKRKVAKISNDEISVVSFAWADGVTSSFDVTELADAMQIRARLLGIATKLQNAYADSFSKGLTIAQSRAQCLELWARLKAGEWTGVSNGGIWVEAISRALGQPIASVQASWAKLSDEDKAKVRKHPKVAKAKLDIEKSRIKKAGEDDLDLSSMFDQTADDEAGDTEEAPE